MPLDRRRWINGLLAALIVAGCSEPGPTPVRSGQIAVDLSTTATTIGAIQLIVRAPAGVEVADLSFTTPLTIYQHRTADGMRIIVTGPVVAGEVLRFTIPDAAKATGYSIVQESAADRNTFALLAAADFHLTARAIPP